MLVLVFDRVLLGSSSDPKLEILLSLSPECNTPGWRRMGFKR